MSEFIHDEISCRILRIFILEPFTKEEQVFGGHLCGYCMIPKDHKYHGKTKDVFTFDYDVHGGITYNEMQDEDHWIGFDCAHCNDIVPSTEKYMEECAIKNFPEFFIKKTYRNFDFVIIETKSLAEQIKNDLNENATD